MLKQKSIGFTHAGFKRLTFRAGAKRTSQSAFHATRDLAERFVENLIYKADCLTGSRRKTIRLTDVLGALERMNQQAYV
jgi:histone H3/H4